MYQRLACVIIIAALPLAITLVAGCESITGVSDVSEDGVLTLEVDHASGSTVAKVTASVGDNRLASLLAPYIVLADDQVLSVNSVPLDASTLTALSLEAKYTATIEAVEDSRTYTIEFDNQGVTTSLNVSPPEDLSDVSPDKSSEVSTNGFNLEWDAPDNDDATISVDIAGKAYSYNSSGVLTLVDHTVSLTNLADDGNLSIGWAELSTLLSGSIDVRLSRTKTLSQPLGFSEGTIILRMTQTLSLTLVEPAE